MKIAFLGPSRPAVIPRGITVLPPARQGDIWRALENKPRAIALIDGVFEQVPSVWHREILDALAEGVTVYGAASMGALRAAELHTFGMVPVGKIARAYVDGTRIDDADVALLCADASHGYRPLTVPLVDVPPKLQKRAAAMHYSERTWAKLGVRNPPPSQKVKDAALCLRKLAHASTGSARAGLGIGSSFQRRARLIATGRSVPAPTGAQLKRLAALARQLGINPSHDPSGSRGIAHRLLHDGMLNVDSLGALVANTRPL